MFYIALVYLKNVKKNIPYMNYLPIIKDCNKIIINIEYLYIDEYLIVV